MSIATLYARAFGEVWPALDTAKLQAMGRWQMDAHGTDGHAIEFGDSHKCKGSKPTAPRPS